MDNNSVLLIDDDAIVREAIRDILEMVDIDVIEGRDGAEGVELYKANRDQVKLVILDMMMPIMDGFETLQVLRDYEPNLKIIMSSGRKDINFKKEDSPHQPNAYLYKPFEIDDLINQVQSFLHE